MEVTPAGHKLTLDSYCHAIIDYYIISLDIVDIVIALRPHIDTLSHNTLLITHVIAISQPDIILIIHYSLLIDDICLLILPLLLLLY